MEVPKFLKCPECDEKYKDGRKRRIIDSCGHPRCFSCLVLDKQCTVCETILGRRRRSWLSSRDSLLSTDDDQDGSKSDRGSTHEIFSKEQYLRTLYSYDPDSTEHVHRRSGSFDLHTKRSYRQINLGRHSSSEMVLPNKIQNSGPVLRTLDGPRRSSLQELIFSRKLSADMQTFNPMSCLNQGNTKDEEARRRKSLDEDSSRLSQVISPRSSGYWSEIECFSDQEGNVLLQSGSTSLVQNIKENKLPHEDEKIGENDQTRKVEEENETVKKMNEKKLVHEVRNINRVQEARKSSVDEEKATIKKTNKDLNELAKIDSVLSGQSCAWQNTKALFSARGVTEGYRNSPAKQRDSDIDWRLRKYFDSHSNNTRHSSLKVTDL